MKKMMSFFYVLSILSLADEGIFPSQFKVEMAKNCEILMLRETPEDNASKIFTSASTGDCVQNMGCIRNITQKALDSIEKKKRYFIAWKNPVWCRVAVGKKQGWVLQQFLADKPCEEL